MNPSDLPRLVSAPAASLALARSNVRAVVADATAAGACYRVRASIPDTDGPGDDKTSFPELTGFFITRSWVIDRVLAGGLVTDLDAAARRVDHVNAEVQAFSPIVDAFHTVELAAP